MSFSQQFLSEVEEVTRKLDTDSIERVALLLAKVREEGGRLFILGVGGSAANASHAVNDFRKIVGLETYAPTDNVSELTARTNDEGWSTVFDRWLRVSKLRSADAVLVFSVGGGNLEKQVSPNLVTALQFAKSRGAKILGIVGRDGHCASCRRMRCDSHRQRIPHHSPFGSVSSDRVALAGVPSSLEGGANSLGINLICE